MVQSLQSAILVSGNYQEIFYTSIVFFILAFLPFMCYSGALTFPVKYFTAPGEIITIYLSYYYSPSLALYLLELDGIITGIQLLVVGAA